ncbi:MAG TPA: hypothetical protein VLJ58_16025 [Ramlibacter sp.]|nr:hypothetical protein [Ramlibacter sp.]
MNERAIAKEHIPDGRPAPALDPGPGVPRAAQTPPRSRIQQPRGAWVALHGLGAAGSQPVFMPGSPCAVDAQGKLVKLGA